jgi:hypothetical protein
VPERSAHTTPGPSTRRTRRGADGGGERGPSSSVCQRSVGGAR